MGIPAPAGIGASGLPPTGDRANVCVTGSFAAIGPGKPMMFQGPFNITIWAQVNTTLTTTANSGSASVASGTGLATGAAISGANVPRGTTWKTFSGTSGTLAFPTICQQGIIIPGSTTVSGLVTTTGLSGSTVTVASNATGVTIPGSTTVSSISTAAVQPSSSNLPGILGSVVLSAAPTVAPSITGPVALEFALTNASVTTGADTAAVFTGFGVVGAATIAIERSFDGGATWLLANIGGGGTAAVYTFTTPLSLAFGEPEAGVLYRVNCTAYTSGDIRYRMSTTGNAARSIMYNQLA